MCPVKSVYELPALASEEGLYTRPWIAAAKVSGDTGSGDTGGGSGSCTARGGRTLSDPTLDLEAKCCQNVTATVIPETGTMTQLC